MLTVTSLPKEGLRMVFIMCSLVLRQILPQRLVPGFVQEDVSVFDCMGRQSRCIGSPYGYS